MEALPRCVLIIGIDGASGAAVRRIVNSQAEYPTSFFRDLIDSGAFFALDSLSAEPPTWSGPGWSSILSGHAISTHHVTDNTFRGGSGLDSGAVDLFARLPAACGVTTSIAVWGEINEFISLHARTRLTKSSDEDATAAALNALRDPACSVVFVQLDDVDHTGHDIGHDTPEYAAALRLAEARAARLVNALYGPSAPRRDWLLLLCSDHGGSGSGVSAHGGSSDAERNGFVMALGRGIRPGAGSVAAVDVAATALAHFGPLEDAWCLDGVPMQGRVTKPRAGGSELEQA